MSTRPWRVYIVDDDEFVVTILTRLLEADGRFVVLGSAASVEDASAGIESDRPDVLVLDNARPDAPGAPAARALRAAASDARVVVLSGSEALPEHEAMGIDRWVHKRDLLTVPDVVAGLLPTDGP